MKNDQSEIEQLRLEQSEELMEVRQELLKAREMEAELNQSLKKERS
jgi:hypothetical protein